MKLLIKNGYLEVEIEGENPLDKAREQLKKASAEDVMREEIREAGKGSKYTGRLGVKARLPI